MLGASLALETMDPLDASRSTSDGPVGDSNANVDAKPNSEPPSPAESQAAVLAHLLRETKETNRLLRAIAFQSQGAVQETSGQLAQARLDAASVPPPTPAMLEPQVDRMSDSAIQKVQEWTKQYARTVFEVDKRYNVVLRDSIIKLAYLPSDVDPNHPFRKHLLLVLPPMTGADSRPEHMARAAEARDERHSVDSEAASSDTDAENPAILPFKTQWPLGFNHEWKLREGTVLAANNASQAGELGWSRLPLFYGSVLCCHSEGRYFSSNGVPLSLPALRGPDSLHPTSENGLTTRGCFW
ncbi:hypothetical protein B0T14DRAFT_4913 [Immersiella caudata]|uniref:Uncharacterized protein n=1 Tax=Immersiella caudata TaxID=314043 RepID=A0AA39XCT0_9PEZI|nr:hypothetical protein B0T14DRAFT_4913 [Immersiella caudata]